MPAARRTRTGQAANQRPAHTGRAANQETPKYLLGNKGESNGDRRDDGISVDVTRKKTNKRIVLDIYSYFLIPYV